MRVLPYFAGAAIAVAVGGAVAGGAIDTTPRKIHEAPSIPAADIDFDQDYTPRAMGANHYPLETSGTTVDVAELRERGLYSQERYARTYYATDTADTFDYDAAASDQEAWEAEQARAVAQRVRSRQVRQTARQPLDLQEPAQVSEARIVYVSRPVVQDTGPAPR